MVEVGSEGSLGICGEVRLILAGGRGERGLTSLMCFRWVMEGVGMVAGGV